MVISKRNKIWLLILVILFAIYYGGKYYDNIQAKKEYELAKKECMKCNIENLYITFNDFKRSEIKKGFLLTIADSSGCVYHTSKEAFFTHHTPGNYVSFELLKSIRQNDTVKFYLANQVYSFSDFKLSPKMVRAYMITIYGNNMRPFGCRLSQLNINGNKYENHNSANIANIVNKNH